MAEYKPKDYVSEDNRLTRSTGAWEKLGRGPKIIGQLPCQLNNSTSTALIDLRFTRYIQ